MEFLNQADFHPVLHQQKGKNRRKVVTCKLTHVSDPINLSDQQNKSVRGNLPLQSRG